MSRHCVHAYVCFFQTRTDTKEKRIARQLIATYVEKEKTAGAALPSGWQQHFDQASGHVYYRNNQTGSTQWEVPTKPVQAREGRSVADELPHGQISMHTGNGRE